MRAPALLILIILIVQSGFSSAQSSVNNAAVEPQYFGYSSKGFLGAVGNKIYQELYHNKWNYLFSLPFAADSGYLALKDSNTILYNRFDDSLFYYNMSDASVEKRDKKKMIESFCVKGIQKLIFSKGYMGCFYSRRQEMTYEQKDGRFILVDCNKSGAEQDSLFGDNDREITLQSVRRFVKKIPALYQKKISISELGFTPKDFELCKRNIIKFKAALERGENSEECSFYIHEKNPDFDRLLSLVDRVKKLDQKMLNQFLAESDFKSTTSFQIGIKLVNSDNEVLEISNNDYRFDNMYFPWEVKLNGSKSTNTAIEINQFIQEIYPRFLGNTDKVTILQMLVVLLYEKAA